MAILSSFGVSGGARAELIKGRVLDPDGKPVPNARMWIDNPEDLENRWRAVPVDENGAWQIELEAIRENYFGRALAVPEKFDVTIAPAYSVLKREDNTLGLRRAKSISGAVVDPNQKPVEGARIELTGAYNQGDRNGAFWLHGSPLLDEYSTLSDAEGKWTVGGVPDGFSGQIFLKDPRFVREHRTAAIGESVIFEVRSGAKISGRAVNEYGKPMTGVLIYGSAAEPIIGGISATTDENGRYEIWGLAAGVYEIFTREKDERVAPRLKNLAVRDGEAVSAPELIFTPGALVTGRVLDASGKPILKALVAARGAYANSDGEGRYRLRVAPGEYSVLLSDVPAEFLRPRHEHKITLSEGQSHALDFQLSRGAVLTGTVVDENNKPAAKVQIRVLPVARRQSDYEFDQGFAETDEKGDWKVAGLPAGDYKIETTDKWILLAPQTVSISEENVGKEVLHPLHLKVREAPLIKYVGRVLASDGKPVEGARVEYYVREPEGGGSWLHRSFHAVSGQDGKFVLEGVREDRDLNFVAAKKNKWQYVAGGKWNKQTGRIADIILDARDATLTGRVLDAQKNPVSKARVVAPGLTPAVETQTDEDGNFSLSELPRGKVDLLFASDNGFAAGQFIGNGSRIQVTLGEMSTPPTRERGLALLENTYGASQDAKFSGREGIVRELELLDPERAARLERNPGAKSEMESVREVSQLARRNPQQAVEEGPALMENVKSHLFKVWGWSELAVAAHKIDPERAISFYQTAKAALEAAPKLADNETNHNTLVMHAMQRVGLLRAAAALKLPEIDALIQEILSVKIPHRDDASLNEGMTPIMIEVLTVYAPERAEQLLASLTGDEKVNALGRMMDALTKDGITREEISRDDFPAERLSRAVKVLDQLRTLEESKGSRGGLSREWATGQAARRLMRVLGARQPTRVVEIARSLQDAGQKARAFALAADYQDAPTALALRREAFELAWNQTQASEILPRLAALIWEEVPDEGAKLFRRIVTRLEEWRKALTAGRYYGRMEIGETAFYLARFDRLQARLLLETEWVRLGMEADQQQASWQRRDLWAAMAAVDWERAWQWTQQLANEKGEPDMRAMYGAQRRLAQWAILDEEGRKTARFDHWSLIEDEEYSRD